MTLAVTALDQLSLNMRPHDVPELLKTTVRGTLHVQPPYCQRIIPGDRQLLEQTGACIAAVQ
eukprot:7461541-Pyramimonas_sp.AAC.1